MQLCGRLRAYKEHVPIVLACLSDVLYLLGTFIMCRCVFILQTKRSIRIVVCCFCIRAVNKRFCGEITINADVNVLVTSMNGHVNGHTLYRVTLSIRMYVSYKGKKWFQHDQYYSITLQREEMIPARSVLFYYISKLVLHCYRHPGISVCSN